MTTPDPSNTAIKASRLEPAKETAEAGGAAQRSPSAEGLGLHVPDAGVTKADAVIAMLRQAQGASVDEIMAATGWQRHSVRGALSGTVKKKLGAAVTSEVVAGVRRYSAPEAAT